MKVTVLISTVLSTKKDGARRVLKDRKQLMSDEENVASMLKETMNFKTSKLEAKEDKMSSYLIFNKYEILNNY